MLCRVTFLDLYVRIPASSDRWREKSISVNKKEKEDSFTEANPKILHP